MVVPTSGEPALPPATTPFVGRQTELVELHDLLATPECRLITLVGPGGIGKTRLAREVSAQQQDRFPDGSVFVPLQAVPSSSLLAATIAEALSIPLQGQEDPHTLVLHTLRNKTMLLVLDNFEHLLDGADLVGSIVQTAPGVRLLVTSREVLNLQDEWLYPLSGLALPPGQEEHDPLHYSAVALFVERARRVRRDFVLAQEQAAVIRICRLVGGMPLALELAAAWAATLSCAEIADEIARNLAFLETRMRDVPERHRSVRATFDQTWTRLNAEEQVVLARLGVFRGGFTREAAAHVAQARLPVLVILVEKAMVQRTATGRYQMHELLRQYAEEHLGEVPEEKEQTRQAHAAFYTTFLDTRRETITDSEQRVAIAEEIDNLRTAWWWIISSCDIPMIMQAVHPLALYYRFRGLHQEGIQLFAQGVHAVRRAAPGEARDTALAQVLVELGWLYYWPGKLNDAHTAFMESHSLYTALGLSPPPGIATDPLAGLSAIALNVGDYAEAVRLGEEAYRRSALQQHTGNRAMAQIVLAGAAEAQGKYTEAQRYAEQALKGTLLAQNRWLMSTCYMYLGSIACTLGKYDASCQYLQFFYDMREEFHDTRGMAMALYLIGKLALCQGDYHEAWDVYHRCLMLFQKVRNQAGCVTAYYGLGCAACGMQEYAVAWEHLAQALQIATELQSTSWVLTIITGIGELLLQVGHMEWGAELLQCVVPHPATFHEVAEQARHLLLQCEKLLAPDQFASAVERGAALDLDCVVARLQEQLARPLVHVETAEDTFAVAATSSVAPLHPPASTLVEPLTEREREVLALLAQGLSNKAIAERLTLSPYTVQSHVKAIFGKLGVTSRTAATRAALDLGLLTDAPLLGG